MKNSGIRSQVLILGLLPVTLIGILLCAYFIGSQLNTLDHIQKSRGLTISEQLAYASEYGVISGNREILNSLTKNLITDKDVTAIRITDRLQNNILKVGDFKLRVDQRRPINTPSVCANSVNATIFCAPIFKVLLSVSDFGEEINDVSNDSVKDIIGYIYLELSSESLREKRQDTITRAIIITLIILMFTGLFAVRTAVNIAKPIEHLTKTVARVEHGDLDITIDATSAREINSLQSGISSMVSALEKHQTHLEDMISERTIELIQEREQAEQANLAKSKFLAAASHDLRQPLHALRLFVDILNRRLDKEEHKSLIDDINRSTDSLEELFNNLLDLSRVEANVLVPEITDFPLQYLFERLRTDYATTAYRKGLWFRIVNTKAVVRSDLAMLERILRNLVSNAIRYTKRGGVLIGCRRRNGQLNIEIWDTGIGIPENEFESIFSEFHQVANPERDRRKGLGLGLAIASGLAKLLNQAILVNSDVGKGTCFTISVPFGTKSELVQQNSESQRSAYDLSDKNVVFIDDEEPVRDAMRHILDECGCNSIIGDDLDQVTQLLDEEESIPDIIIVDYRLRGGITGIEVIRQLRKKYASHIPAMIITGDTSPEWLKDAESNNSHILFKPVKAEKLYSEMAKLLKLKSTTAEN